MCNMTEAQYLKWKAYVYKLGARFGFNYFFYRDIIMYMK